MWSGVTLTKRQLAGRQRVSQRTIPAPLWFSFSPLCSSLFSFLLLDASCFCFSFCFVFVVVAFFFFFFFFLLLLVLICCCS